MFQWSTETSPQQNCDQTEAQKILTKYKFGHNKVILILKIIKNDKN